MYRKFVENLEQTSSMSKEGCDLIRNSMGGSDWPKGPYVFVVMGASVSI